jgi:hypothetical protein
MLPRPAATTSGVQLTTVDVLPLSATATAGADGAATIEWDPVAGGYLWLVTAGSVRTTSTTPTQVQVWAGPRLMDGSNSGNFDFSDRSSPILVAANEGLKVVWTSATPGSVCTFDGQYNYVARGA